jgi:hypothetical protein
LGIRGTIIAVDSRPGVATIPAWGEAAEKGAAERRATDDQVLEDALAVVECAA